LAIALVKSKSVSPARRVAFEILQRVADGAYASVLLARRDPELNALDRNLCHELVMGVLRWQLWLDRLSEHYSDRSIDELDPAVRIILRLGLYQLRFLTKVPPSAAVNESVNLTTLARLRSAGAFVNAVLRRATREPNIDPAANIADELERLSASTSHPRWLIERWSKALGKAEAEAFARANNEPAPIAFRVVKTRANEADICTRLREAGAELVKSEVTDDAWRVAGTTDLLREMAGNGEIYLQDEASQLVSHLLQPQSGERILDVCAAPGSKTSQIADLTCDSSKIVAGDLYEHRLATIVATAKLQAFKSIHCVALDGLQTLPFPEVTFDSVLLDAPCTGTGTLRRNPEIRWRLKADDIQDLAARQKKILLNAARVLKPGGRLVYSTCSVEPEENEEVVRAFLESETDFRVVDIQDLSKFRGDRGTFRLWPQHQGTDGFFIGVMERAR
jgi:16S rRNA (cytosine967-C5)-methyltransferase